MDKFLIRSNDLTRNSFRHGYFQLLPLDLRHRTLPKSVRGLGIVNQDATAHPVGAPLEFPPFIFRRNQESLNFSPRRVEGHAQVVQYVARDAIALYQVADELYMNRRYEIDGDLRLSSRGDAGGLRVGH